jgi:hypothetical protein
MAPDGASLGLSSTSHLVGHLLREIENGISDALRPLAASWPAEGEKGAHAKRITALSALLGIDDQEFEHLWRAYATGLAKWAHREARDAPRPLSSEFLDVWNQGLAVLDLLTSRIEASYAQALPAAAALATGPPNVSAFKQRLLHSPSVLDRFFELAGTEWLELLRKEGVFASPPPLVPREDGTVAFARWPAGAFLVRCAPEMPETVLQIALELDTDNPEAHESLIDAAFTMSPELAAQFAPKVEVWLETPARWRLPFKARDLGIHLVTSGQMDSGLSLIRALFLSLGLHRGRTLGAEFIERITQEIFPAAGIAGVELLADLLAAALQDERLDGEDYSYVWRPSLEIDERQDVRNELISALRSGADAVVAADAQALEPVLASFEARPLTIFRRLSVRLLLNAPLTTVAERVRERLQLDDPGTENEYAALLAARFRELDQQAQEIVLHQIDAGPEGVGDDAELAERWRLRWLSRLPPPLPAPWRARYQALVDRFGQPSADALRPMRTRAGWAQSPIAADELESMAVPEVISFLREWVPDDGTWRAPSRAGLESALRQVVSNRAADFAAAAKHFARLRPAYASAFLSGLEEALRQGRIFPWDEVLGFCKAALAQPSSEADDAPKTEVDDDQGWRSVRQRIAHLICDGLGTADGGIPGQERERVWDLISGLARDNHPSPEDERGSDLPAFGSATLALNSVRGAAMRAAIVYVWWLHDPKAGPSAVLPREAKALLDHHLDPSADPSAAIRSVYGQFFPYLAAADPRWAEANVARIFPDEPERLWRAAWHSYLQFNGVWETAFRLLREQYSRGIRELREDAETDTGLDDPVDGLINHLMLATRWGLIDAGCDTGLLGDFFAIAPLGQRSLAISRVGLHLLDAPTLSDEERERLGQLWECRLAAVRASTNPEAGREVRGFGWWFASGALDQDWSLDQLMAAMEVSGPIDGERDVLERLTMFFDVRPAAVLRALERLIVAASSEWFVHGARDLITPLLQRALAGNPSDARIAEDIVNRLVARGHGDFLRLIGP